MYQTRKISLWNSALLTKNEKVNIVGVKAGVCLAKQNSTTTAHTQKQKTKTKYNLLLNNNNVEVKETFNLFIML